DLAGIAVQRSRLPDQIERQIAERQILLEHRRVAAPLGESMAEHERVVGEAQRIDEQRRLGAHLLLPSFSLPAGEGGGDRRSEPGGESSPPRLASLGDPPRERGGKPHMCPTSSARKRTR